MLIRKAIPNVSREFALELKRRFPPIELKVGFDRDEAMQSVGEQRVIKWILHASNNSVVQGTTDVVGTKETNTDIDLMVAKVQEIKSPEPEAEEKVNWFKRFTNRFGN